MLEDLRIKQKIITVIGGGNVGHAIAGYTKLYNSNNVVRVLTRSPDRWSHNFTCYMSEGNKDNTFNVNLDMITDDYQKAIKNSEIIMLTVPHFATKEIINKIKNVVSKSQVVMGIPAGAGFDWITKDLQCNVIGMQRTPFVSRIVTYGKSVNIAGIRPINKVAVKESDTNCKFLLPNILEYILGAKFELLNNFLECTLTNSNPLLHPSRYTTRLSRWKHETPYKSPLYFYADWDDEASKLYVQVDNELQNIRHTLPVALNNITTVYEHYESNSIEGITNKIKSIQSLKNVMFSMIRKPEGYYIDWESRYFSEDILYGLLPIIEIANLCGVPVPYMQKMAAWGIENADLQYNKESLPLPQNYGILSKEDLILQTKT